MVDMVTSLKQNYGRVEVVVLNVDLISNMIDMVVIGDRLFSLPIQVENEEHEVQMDVDDGSNNSKNGHGNPSESNDKNSSGSQNYDKLEGSRQDKGNSSGGKHGNVPSR
jgi:hypothetical protein